MKTVEYDPHKQDSPETITTLLVEDCVDMQKLYKITLQQIASDLGLKISIVTATTAENAIDSLKQVPDLVVLDYYLHEGTSAEPVAEEIERISIESGREITTILISALNTRNKEHEEIYEHLLKSGVHCTLDKTAGEVIRVHTLLNLMKSIRDKKEIQRLLSINEFYATHDEFTGLFNRRYARTHIENLILEHRIHGKGFSLLFCDLDGFKKVNDLYGHNVGNKLIIELANRLKELAIHGNIVARLHGGDEFLFILEDITDPELLEQYIQEINDAISRPYSIDGHEIVIDGSSFGISSFPKDGKRTFELLKHADEEMFRNKLERKLERLESYSKPDLVVNLKKTIQLLLKNNVSQEKILEIIEEALQVIKKEIYK